MIPSVSDREAFVRWWQEDAQGVRLQVPVLVEFSPLGGSGARILEGQKGGEPAIKLVLDDSRLGIGLASRLADLCEDSPCRVWAEGRAASEEDRLGPPLAGQEGAGLEIRLILESVKAIEPGERLDVQFLK